MAEEGSTGVIDDGGKPNDATDWKAEARKWEARAKAEKLDSELKAVIAKAAHDEAVAKVAKETGVPASLIKGESEDEMREFAQSVAAYAKPATGARTPRNGAFDNRGAHDADEAKRRLAKQGIIPAHAGSTLFALIGPPTERDHPRACGEHLDWLPEEPLDVGSSPRMRGAPGEQPSARPTHGIIPAHAGSTQCIRFISMSTTKPRRQSWRGIITNGKNEKASSRHTERTPGRNGLQPRPLCKRALSISIERPMPIPRRDRQDLGRDDRGGARAVPRS